MENNYFIIHGSFGSPHINWFPYLFKKIEEKGRKVYCPQFPIGVGLQNYDNWSKLMKYYLDLNLINKNTIIFGHSIAPSFICHFLIENNIKVKRLVFVCGFNNYLGINEEYDTVNKTMYINNIERIHNLCDDITCIYSDNDPYVKLDALESFANLVSNNKIIIKNGGHLNSEFGYNEFGELLKYID